MQGTVELSYGEFWLMFIPAAILYTVVLFDIVNITPILLRTLRMRYKHFRYKKKKHIK